ncbi:MAG: TrkH family potassium uptake protein [Christensenellales bacterium]
MFGKKREAGQHVMGKPGMSPAKVLAGGFFLIILAGALLLMLPISNRSGHSLGFLEALFTSTSATCVTGLTVVDTYGTFTIFGQIVTICLIQVGGLGFMLFATITLVALGRRISLRNRMLLRETMSMPGLSGGVRTSMRFLLIAFLIELTGALLLSLRFIPLYGAGKGLFFGTYHAISAFCNAGFDLFGEAGSLQGFHSDPLVLLTISFLIVLGGLGFTVISDFMEHGRHPRQMRLHSKIVLVSTATLLLGGLAVIALMEWNNGQTLAFQGAGAGDKLLNAWLQSVTTRTAGFYSFSQAAMTETSKFISIVLMFIGASPASTGGGIKTSSMFVVIMIMVATINGREDINVYGKRIPAAVGRTAQTILFLYLSLIILGALLLTVFERGSGFLFLDMLFEEASALGTVGLSAVGTARFQPASKMLLITLMYFGRVGPLTMMLTLNRPATNGSGGIRYLEEQIIVG